MCELCGVRSKFAMFSGRHHPDLTPSRLSCQGGLPPHFELSWPSETGQLNILLNAIPYFITVYFAGRTTANHAFSRRIEGRSMLPKPFAC